MDLIVLVLTIFLLWLVALQQFRAYGPAEFQRPPPSPTPTAAAQESGT